MYKHINGRIIQKGIQRVGEGIESHRMFNIEIFYKKLRLYWFALCSLGNSQVEINRSQTITIIEQQFVRILELHSRYMI